MNYKEETYVLKILERIRADTKENNKLLKENNIMLKQIIKVINTYIVNHHNENEDDFIRNILANLVSNKIDLFKLK